MNRYKNYRALGVLLVLLAFSSCQMLAPVAKTEPQAVPDAYVASKDTVNSATIKWKSFFPDKNLQNLIDVALKNNQELAMTLQEIEIARNDVRVKKECCSQP